MSDYEPRFVSADKEQLRKEEKELPRFILEGVYENLDIALEGVIYFKKRIVRLIVLMGAYLVAMIVFLFALDAYVPVEKNIAHYIGFTLATAAIAVCFVIAYRRNWQAYWDAWKEARSQTRDLCAHYDAIGITNKSVLETRAWIEGEMEEMPERFK